MLFVCLFVVSVDMAKGKVDLSLRLSQVDPVAAKKLRQKLGRRKESKSKPALSSDGEEKVVDMK